ncbi:hypothetical protein HanRHA438_Chr00c13g0849451 [Helianthus annuus]|uniref:Uncharacterized protein n=1 Tax=Helianthus annuus TaxID=4232 RepID=A0A9K3EKI8_HELAN|nr:hypothetical protein HanXRQr2_Chr13g0607911 [Helianthus annuus]KAJ0449540.1 hypothetical protein HanHA89_Chr17g0729621 [Helianthus annuus]KAJ0478274.1 hypothetical protein HanHA300_Chr13g0498381 [Helianthus annuus]KAJ0499158.1 hypothetical protein HanHA89_Chr13g0531051 [Helianthus annuus]KAJ0665172.1 hypothetical protein HanLR1_Chr13g0501081 [Helianthus annuus]
MVGLIDEKNGDGSRRLTTCKEGITFGSSNQFSCHLLGRYSLAIGGVRWLFRAVIGKLGTREID